MTDQKTPSKLETVSSELRRLESANDVLMQIQVFALDELKQLNQNAHRLLAAVKLVVDSQWQHRCSDKIGGCTAVSESKLRRLEAVLQKTSDFKFQLPPAKLMQKLRRLAKQPLYKQHRSVK